MTFLYFIDAAILGGIAFLIITQALISISR